MPLLDRNKTSATERVRGMEEKVPCEVCGRSTSVMDTKRCDSCWSMESGFTSLRNHDLEKARKWLSEQLESLEGKETKVKSGGFMKGQSPGIRGSLCQLVIKDLDYLIEHGIFADDVQAVQLAIIHIATEERAKKLREPRPPGKWQEENA
ncbi:MAG: hypothetical protein WCE94_03365 [Candidatus Methanoperedens sp.]